MYLKYHLYRLAYFTALNLVNSSKFIVLFSDDHHTFFHGNICNLWRISPTYRKSEKTCEMLRLGILDLKTLETEYEKILSDKIIDNYETFTNKYIINWITENYIVKTTLNCDYFLERINSCPSWVQITQLYYLYPNDVVSSYRQAGRNFQFYTGFKLGE
jgi:hypothetical protein